MLTRLLRSLSALASCFLLAHCTSSLAVPDSIRLEKKSLHSFDGDVLPFTEWTPKSEPELVVIAVHGISGAASDYRPLAEHLLTDLPRTAVYAAETRGQGNDPIISRQGDICHRSEWFRDLYSFTRLIREKHPKAKIVWCGESMGSLIALHAYAATDDPRNHCDALILSSPIVAIRGDFPSWKEKLAHFLAKLMPSYRVSLEGLSGQKEVEVVKGVVHENQATQNSYHVERHTLRLLSTLGDMISKAGSAGRKLDLPVLLLHGGKDVFSEPKDVEKFASRLPHPAEVTRRFYPESYHLLFFDHESERVISDITAWLKKLK
ncbi:lysophospholipase [Akkermansiaceae bacterium]|nr:lysophospholipase [Akkermansiaceae bacterium]MDB4259062.1 lysophospholipase [Akkermansiaceae bacterium]MDB4268425.1 lysophospholipase [Akkermansiaceae bacterium]MDB4295435.1 lysophospholipase [Akkermansiaceae bacterium]MDB4323615.1 lysophospholipase [Akkermansiaceae bacterium]